MKFQAIFMSAAVTVAVFTGLTLSHQEFAQAQGIGIGGNVDAGGNNVGLCVGVNQPASCTSGGTAQVPTPALLPGLIGLGVGLLRKRKAQKAEVDI